MATLEFEDRVQQSLRHLPAGELAAVKRAFDRLEKEPGRLPDAKEFPSDPNTLLLAVSPELRLIYRYENPQNGLMHIVVEDIVSRRTLERAAEQRAS